MTFVVAGGIVRNRAWILPRHLSAVARCRPDAMFYVTGDNEDETNTVLADFAVRTFNELGPRAPRQAPFNYLVHDTGEPGWTRDGKEAPRYRSAHMAAERNLWAREALERWPQATHLWVVDSDVLPAPDVLERLLALKAPVAAAYVPVGTIPIHMMGWDSEHDRPKRTGEEKLLTKPHIVSMVGGCYLIDARLLGHYPPPEHSDPPLPYWKEHPQGEDGGFAESVLRMGANMLVDPLAGCEHIMERDDA